DGCNAIDHPNDDSVYESRLPPEYSGTFEACANPAEGYRFDHWTADGATLSDSHSNPTIAYPTGPTTIEAWFVPVRLHTTTTNVNCVPSSVNIGGLSTCTATVRDTDTNPIAPTGTVSFSSSASGIFTGSPC